VTKSLDPRTAGVAFVTHWLRGRYGAARECPENDGYHWTIEPAGLRRPFAISIESSALESGLGNLRDWLEQIADHVRANTSSTDRYRVAVTGVEILR
jgi:hypothetical protein